MAVPRQMTAHSLEAKKGWPSPHAVDFSAKFHTSGADALIDGYVAFAGSLVSLNSSGIFIYGCAGGAMPMWLLQNSDDPDVENPGGTLLTGASGTAVHRVGRTTSRVQVDRSCGIIYLPTNNQPRSQNG